MCLPDYFSYGFYIKQVKILTQNLKAVLEPIPYAVFGVIGGFGIVNLASSIAMVFT